MKLKSIQPSFIYVTALLHIVLFTYAAVSKILDFQNFQIQIGQSPLLSAFTLVVSYGVPAVEIALVLLLFTSKYRWLGLYGSFFLMVMFTAYIFIILNFSSFIPCSCGGILEKMTWNEHLVFNMLFVALSGVAIIFESQSRFVYGFLSINLITAVAVVTVLFLLSEDIIQHRNNFVRRLPEQIDKTHDTDLKFNSYYFAGAANGRIYLGNVTMPLLLTEIDTLLKTKKEITVSIDDMKLPFRSVQIQVQHKYFYITDGTVPAVFRGKTGNWKATRQPIKMKQFANQVYIDSVSVAYRTRKENSEAVLGFTGFGNDTNSFLNPALLQKQIDGIFDTDGLLMFDEVANKAVYLYYYRNQFIVTDPKLNLISRGKTIDTVSKAHIKVATNTDRNEMKLSAPPLTVNKNACLHKGLLFVNSTLIGKFEDAKMWKQTSMIDVYDYKNNAYIQSFYVYHIDGKRLSRFLVYGNNFYGLVGTHIVSYRLNDIITNRYSTAEYRK